jgi:predicted nuclease of predicted toxin-antitoxin system
VKFLVDNQLPAALARFLASRGADCQHVLDLNLADSTDVKIWEYASQNDYVIISKDEDFLYLANSPSSKARFIWIRFGNCRTNELLAAVGRLEKYLRRWRILTRGFYKHCAALLFVRPRPHLGVESKAARGRPIRLGAE